MSSYTGLSPDNPKRYTGTNVYLSTIVTRKREPTGADYRQPETGSLYRTGSFWLIGPAPTNGAQGDLWYLSKIVSNVAFWIKFGTGSSGPLLNVDVDAATAPGVDPVTPDVNGLMTVTGKQVASGSAGTEGIQTHSTALNQYQIRVQQAATAASVDITKNGLAHFSSDHFTNTTGFIDAKPATEQASSSFANAGIASFNSTQFDVDGNGFVTLAGGGLAIDSINVDANTAPGTDPVVPDATGQITVTGAQVAAGVVGTNVIRTDSLAANTYTIEIQRSTTAATPTIASNGVSHFNSANFDIDANAFVTAKAGLQPGVSNLGISFSSNTFSVTSSTGAALSSTNFAFVTFPSSVTPGTLVNIKVTANQTFVDHNGASTIDGNLFGFTAGDVQSTDVPFFLYAVLNSAAGSPETDVSFMISRQAGRTLSPNAANIGKTGSAVADNEFSFFALSDPTVADYASSPCIMVGSFRMTKVSASDGWVISTLTSVDGINRFQQDQIFSLSTGTFGAATGSYWLANGGTAPIFNSQFYQYMIQPSGWINVSMTGLTPSTNGAGAVGARMITPMRNKITDNFPIQTGGRLQTTLFCVIAPTPEYAVYDAKMIIVFNGGGAELQNGDMGAACQNVAVNLYYYPRTS